MSIQSEITRIQQAKEGIAEAISEKGITVPDGASISDMPEYIGQIPAIEEVKAEITERLSDHDTSDVAHAAIRELFKSGASASEIKAALAELGKNYKDLYTLANTLKTFLESHDTADSTINTWREIEDFLNGLTDRETLTGLMEQEHQKLKADFEAKFSDLDTQFVTLHTRQDITEKKRFTDGIRVTSHLTQDNPGILIDAGAAGYAVIILGDPEVAGYAGLYKDINANSFWREKARDGEYWDIQHPRKFGTIALTSDLASKVSSSQVKNIAGPMTADQYAALTPDANTLYIITD